MTGILSQPIDFSFSSSTRVSSILQEETSMSSFEEDEELEEKIKQDPSNFDEDELQDIQIYKSQKLQSLRDQGESGDRPDWWSGDGAPETMGELAAVVTGEGSVDTGSDDSDEEEAEEETAETEEESEPSDEAEPETDEESSDESEEETETEPAAEEEPQEPAEEPQEKEPATKTAGVPQVGWSSGVPETDEVDFSDEEIQGIYQRQDQLMESIKTLSESLSQVDVGGETIESIQQSLNELNEKVDALQDEGPDEELSEKVNEIYDLLLTTRDAESKLAELPPLAEDEEYVEAGIIDQAVEHDGSEECFHTSIDNHKAALFYGVNPDRLTAYHFSLPTILSEPVRHAVEDLLARALFEYAREEDLMVHPQASQIRSGFLARHPEYYEMTPESVQDRRRRV
jgi:chemotaxis protein histidine kinase CheA